MIRQQTIYQITHIICAKCGYDNSVENRDYEVETGNLVPNSIFKIHRYEKYIDLFFCCQNCKEMYRLPFIER